ARRILDRLVGYKLSPVLWKRYYRGLSAGRVQSVAARLIVEREREIEKFKPEEYWTLTASLLSDAAKDTPIVAQLTQKDGKALDKFAINTQAKADQVVADLNGATYTVASVERTEVTRMPHAPFTTSTLQQEASRRLHYSSKQTMMFAQGLY